MTYAYFYTGPTTVTIVPSESCNELVDSATAISFVTKLNYANPSIQQILQ